MKTILVVSYHFPPEEGSCSEKNIRIVQLLLDYGYKVAVLTKPGLKEVLINSNLKIIRTEKIGIFHKNETLSDCVRTPSIGHDINNNKIKSILSSMVLPDGTIDWFFEVKKFFRINKRIFDNIDLILSISSPYSAHLVSSYLATKLKIPYIMSYGDPWIYEPKRKRGWIRYNIEFQLEKNLINKCDGLLVITDWNKNKYKRLYNIPEEKINTFHIGYSNEDVLDLPSASNETFNIIYGGSLDPVHRDPLPFIKALKRIEGVKISIFNNDRPDIGQLIKDNGVNEKVMLSPLIRASDFLKEMYKNDALLLFGNRTPFQVPGKVFTYIATGKTIIYIKNNNFTDDGTEEVLNKYGNAIILKNCEDDIIAKINDFLYYNKSRSSIMNKDVFEFHNTMRPICEMIERVLNK